MNCRITLKKKKKLAWMNKLQNIFKVNWKEKKEKEKVGADQWKWGVLGHAKLDLEVKILEIGVF